MYIYLEISGSSMYFPTSYIPSISCENLIALSHENAPMGLEIQEMNQSILGNLSVKETVSPN